MYVAILYCFIEPVQLIFTQEPVSGGGVSPDTSNIYSLPGSQ